MFTHPSMESYSVVVGEYSFSIILLSVIIASFASYTAISMNERMQENSFFHRNLWLILASVALGFGIWSMHFIGMGAYLLPISMTYKPELTFLSIIPAIASSFLVFTLVNRTRKTIGLSLISGVAMGIGISAMHYIGMASMESDAIYTYDRTIFTASVAIAISISFIAIYIFSSLQHLLKNKLLKTVTSLVMGLAISSMHYTGLMGTTYYIHRDKIDSLHEIHQMDMNYLNITVSIGLGLLLLLLLLSSFIDRYIDYRVNYFESLTRIPNRRSFENMLNSPSYDGSLAMWYIPDIEKINVEQGYIFGDKVIQYLGRFFSQWSSSSMKLYQLQGKRFVFLLQGVDGIVEFERTMNKVAEQLKALTEIDGKLIKIEAVCAMSTTEEHRDPKRLYTEALTVLEHPSTRYDYQVIRFDNAIHSHSFEEEILESIEGAMHEGQLFMVYQPKVRASTNELSGFEALIRWKHPKYGMLSPVTFIPILEQSTRIGDVTNWIIEQVCKQIAEWGKTTFQVHPVSINIPGDYVTSPILLNVLTEMVKKYKLEPYNLELEITETSVVNSIEDAVKALNTFREKGFSVALDDFGTGVSSLSYLKRLPISTLKIDKSFIDDVPQSEKDSSILKAILAIGRTLNLDIVLEGVETEEQVQFLSQESESLIFQGYYFAKPMTSTELLNWLAQRKPV
ncbi:bifunctional diguanylate cyclase/phosphodiesterase [Sporosarcina psychrophila]|uniref:EAL domain-containing protein (Putative c-di-GMP-specific phosphodiesterase class I)/NO-binding membrane sensor protein with MHYT domain/GGDEF domain-containing protein n=1 Tax=Sporosarcina psychrophila TaxID=1476 RepID=A0ABV2K680_SPOPS